MAVKNLVEGPFGLSSIDTYNGMIPKPWGMEAELRGNGRYVVRVTSAARRMADSMAADAWFDPAHPEADLDAAKEWLFNLATVAYEGE